MDLTATQAVLTGGVGGLVGLVLSLVGGGGSVLAVPLLVHLVGVPAPHLAIGTSAVAVALNAAVSLAAHARAGHVRWPCAGVFAGFGVGGALLGAAVGKRLDGQVLLVLFALLMVAVAAAMLRRREAAAAPAIRLSRANAPALAGVGGAVGLLSGFFGIGGGFLAVPGLIAATGMATLPAIGSSLVAVTAFGLATAASYALSGLVDWPMAALFVGGGMVGSLAGARGARLLAGRPRALTRLLAGVILLVAAFTLARGTGVLG